MINIVNLSRQIRGLRDALEALELQVREAGQQVDNFLLADDYPALVADWRDLIDAAAGIALAADEVLHPPT